MRTTLGPRASCTLYWSINFDRRIPKKHPAYSCFTPTEKWDKKPRVLTDIRKHPQIRAHAIPGSWAANRDIHMLHVWAWGLQLQVVNTYNAPYGSIDPGRAIPAMDHQQQPVPHHGARHTHQRL
ncbi:hypothetical protein VTO42DRAFT_2099 [Malbranchea cinnamomea]